MSDSGRPFIIYRIICPLRAEKRLGAALVYGSDHPHHHLDYTKGGAVWYNRGSWTGTGAFWRTKDTIKRHIWQLCHDWETTCREDGYGGDYFTQDRITEAPEWTRLAHLTVEETVINDHHVNEICAMDFMGVLEPAV